MIDTAAAPLGIASSANDLPAAPFQDWHVGWRQYVVVAISIGVLVASIVELSKIDLARSLMLLPLAPAFWMLFAIYYLAGPLFDWLIFRRLWKLPLRGIAALLRKTISNEILVGYSGEVYFYAWSRRNVRLSGTPFGAIKDVAVLSACIGNVATLALFLAAWPAVPSLERALSSSALATSVAVITIAPIAALFLGRRLFTLRRGELAFVSAIHLARIVVTTILAAAVWHYLMPSAPLRWWVVLGAMRLLVSRLPFVPNKDIVLAAIATIMVGPDAQVSDLVTVVAALTLGTHILVGAVLFLIGLFRLDNPIADQRSDSAS